MARATIEIVFFCLSIAPPWILAWWAERRLVGDEEDDRNLFYRVKSYASWISVAPFIALLGSLVILEELHFITYFICLFAGLALLLLIQEFAFKHLHEKISANPQGLRAIFTSTWSVIVLTLVPLLLYVLVVEGLSLLANLYLSDSWLDERNIWIWIVILIALGLSTTAFLTPWVLKVLYRAKRVQEGRFFRAAQKAAGILGTEFEGVYLYPDWPAGRAVVLTDLHGKVTASESLERLLNDCELETIALHEAAHLKNKHLIFLLALSISIGVFSGLMIALGLPLLLEQAEKSLWISQHLGKWGWIFIAPSMGLLGMLAILALFFWSMRQMEFSADRSAVLHGASREDLVSALAKLHQKNLIGSRWTWLDRFFQTHPSLNSRIEQIRKINTEAIRL